MQSQITSLLKQNKMHVTPCRKMILELFLSNHVALSHHDIETKYNSGYDRITIYRTLHAFVRKGILQVIPTLNNFALYTLKCVPENDHIQYIHFLCKSCRQMTLVSAEQAGCLQLPAQFIPQEINTIIEGKCPSCHQIKENN